MHNLRLSKRLRGKQAILIIALLLLGLPPFAQAVFTMPTKVTVTMYTLDRQTSGKGLLCGTTNTRIYGCSFDGNRDYPYKDSSGNLQNPAIVDIEGDYLLDVVPRESNPEPPFNFNRTAVQAQAAVARSYVYNKIAAGTTIDNSASSNQTFVPFVFDRLGLASNVVLNETIPLTIDPCTNVAYLNTHELTVEQGVVCSSVKLRQYLSSSTDDSPIFSEYSADYPDGATPVLVNTPPPGAPTPIPSPFLDPISGSDGTCGAFVNGHGRGLTQVGADRWARGNRCGGEKNSDFIPWSVRFGRSEQILSHYYTGINIRDNSKALVAPAYRWVPLKIDWGAAGARTPVFRVGSSYTVQLQIQNTDTVDWTCAGPTTYTLVYSWVKTGIAIPGTTRASVCGVNIGKTINVSLALIDVPTTPAPYGVAFDMIKTTNGNDVMFSNATQNAPAGWQAYVNGAFVCLPSGCRTNLSLLTNGSNAALRSSAPAASDVYPPPATATPNPYPPPATATSTPLPLPTNTPAPTPTSTPAPTPFGGTFPTGSILDTFNRAVGALGSGWSGDVGGYQIMNNAARVLGGGAIFRASSYGANQEAYVTLTAIKATAQEIDLLFKAQDTSTCNVLEVWYEPRTNAVRVQTCSSGTWTEHGSLAVTYQQATALAHGRVPMAP